jgi:mannan endo-1,6-alpha-mannosidase
MKSTYRVCAGLGVASLVLGLDIDVNDTTSIGQAAAEIANGLYFFHDAASTAGDFDQPQPYYWWLSGNGWEALLNYMSYTNTTTYQADFLTAMSENIGPAFDFDAPAQAAWEANDDQMYWVYNALTAMEYDFEPLPCIASADGGCENSWLSIGTNGFEDFVTRWNEDNSTCGGGLQWQYNPEAAGFIYKNAVTNGGFFQTAARLARYTGNQTFADWATTIWDWSAAIGIISTDFHVFDGTWDDANCTVLSSDQWSYNIASYIHGAAHMYAFTTADLQETWESRVQGLVAAAESTFFGPSTNATMIMYEEKCELVGSCETDQVSFKGSLSRWLGKAAVLVPSVSDIIIPLLKASAQGAAAACSGYSNSTCGMKWYIDGFDGQSGFGVTLSALEVVQSLLITDAPALASAS